VRPSAGGGGFLATVESGFQYRGELRETALPEILYTIDRFQVPGIIEASRGDVLKRVFIKEGNVVHATSSSREDSLGTYLQESGLLTAGGQGVAQPKPAYSQLAPDFSAGRGACEGAQVVWTPRGPTGGTVKAGKGKKPFVKKTKHVRHTAKPKHGNKH